MIELGYEIYQNNTTLFFVFVFIVLYGLTIMITNAESESVCEYFENQTSAITCMNNCFNESIMNPYMVGYYVLFGLEKSQCELDGAGNYAYYSFVFLINFVFPISCVCGVGYYCYKFVKYLSREEGNNVWL